MLMHSVDRNSSQNLGMSNKSGQFQNTMGSLFTTGKGYVTGIDDDHKYMILFDTSYQYADKEYQYTTGPLKLCQPLSYAPHVLVVKRKSERHLQCEGVSVFINHILFGHLSFSF